MQFRQATTAKTAFSGPRDSHEDRSAVLWNLFILCFGLGRTGEMEISMTGIMFEPSTRLETCRFRERANKQSMHTHGNVGEPSTWKAQWF